MKVYFIVSLCSFVMSTTVACPTILHYHECEESCMCQDACEYSCSGECDENENQEEE